MYKRGDTVVCIENHSFVFEGQISSHKKGNMYHIIDIGRSGNGTYSYYVESDKSHPDPNNRGLWFYEHKTKCGIFSEHFISLAEWRDKQIDSILNE